MNYPLTESSALIGIKTMAGKLTMSYPANGMDKVTTVKVFKPVLIRIVCVRTTIKVMG